MGKCFARKNKNIFEPDTTTHILEKRRLLWQYGLWSFQTGGTKLERKLLNLENSDVTLPPMNNRGL